MSNRANSPFWWLAIGLGLAFVITSGRAKAVYDVLTAKIAPPAIPPTLATLSCPEGQIWSVEQQACIVPTPSGPNAPPQSAEACRMVNGTWNYATHECILPGH